MDGDTVEVYKTEYTQCNTILAMGRLLGQRNKLVSNQYFKKRSQSALNYLQFCRFSSIGKNQVTINRVTSGRIYMDSSTTEEDRKKKAHLILCGIALIYVIVLIVRIISIR